MKKAREVKIQQIHLVVDKQISYINILAVYNKCETLNRREALKRGAAMGSIILIGGACEFIYPDTEKAREEAKRESIENLFETGMGGNLSLVDLRNISGFDNAANGFLFISETTNGKTEKFLQFAWEINAQDKKIDQKIIVSKLPLEKVQFKKTNKRRAKTTLNFGLTGLNNVYANPNDALIYVDVAVFTIAQKDAARFKFSSK